MRARAIHGLVFGSCLAAFAASAHAEGAPRPLRPAPAQFALAGPRVEIAGGALAVLSSPIFAAMVFQATGSAWLRCGGVFRRETSSSCDRKANDREDRAAVFATLTGGLVAVAGTALLAHGGRRLRQRKAQNTLLEPAIRLGPSPSAGLSWSLRF